MGKSQPVSTYSIAARDPETESLGIAVQSKFLAVGSVVPRAKAGVGAIATQAWGNTSYGPKALRLLSDGLDVETVARRLVDEDDGRDYRQFGLIDSNGDAFAYTGSVCGEWAGHVSGTNFTCQGNILAGGGVVEAMADAFQTATDGDFADKLLAALRTAEDAGGDRRGRQSAAILIVREGAGYGGFNDRYIDLRVDDDPDPIAELARLVNLFRQTFDIPERE